MAGALPLTIPFEFYGNAIWFKGTVNQRGPFQVQLDTAAGGCVLNTSQVGEAGLEIQKEFYAHAGSGDQKARLSVLPPTRIEFGGASIELERSMAVPLDVVAASYGKPIEAIVGYELMAKYVGFSQTKAQSLTRSDIGGILGEELMRRFRVWLDYPRGQMILEPGAQYKDPFESDAGGMRVRSEGPPFRQLLVGPVAEDSPAERAGVKEGDRILEFAGKPAGKLSVWELRKMLRKSGQTYQLRLRRGDEEVTAVVATQARY